MTFYEILTPYYDDIFPANPKQIQFISSYMEKGSSLLDVGAGTGNVALALVKDGYKVIAMEPEEMMAAKILKKAVNHQEQFHVSTLSMEQLHQLQESYDGIYCIGNTLVHLSDIDKIKDFLSQTFMKLKENGKLIIQIVNYEKKNFSFPIMEKDGFTFERDYKYEEGKVLFTTTLTVKGKSMSSTIPLYPATAKQLLPILKEIGFQSIETYANFDKIAYSEEAPALVLVATK